MRALLSSSKVHDYASQGQGEGSKRVLEGIIHGENGEVAVPVSLYRPNTKQGDPRIWFSCFRDHASPGDVCAVFIHGAQIHLLNLTRSPLAEDMFPEFETPLTTFFLGLSRLSSAISKELLNNLRQLAANGPLEATCTGSTAVGRSVEAALGITINSAKAPDYKGIELKSGRSTITGRETRATLFACVPDWSLSRCKSSKAILDEFGYHRGDQFKLYCTVTTQGNNPQGLMFEIDEGNRWLREKCITEPVREVAVWRLPTLEQSLAAKHKETFWIKADSQTRNGREHFSLKSVIHTRDPNIPQLERMLSDGSVTMDHLIKRKPTGGAHEKGPLFKVTRPRLKELFLGEPKQYSLV